MLVTFDSTTYNGKMHVYAHLLTWPVIECKNIRILNKVVKKNY